MSIVDYPILESDSAKYEFGTPNWNPTSYRCHLAIVRENDGSFSAIVLNLPGAGSVGASEEEAIESAKEAVAGVIESYIEDGEQIPWITPEDYTPPADAKLRWIIVNV